MKKMILIAILITMQSSFAADKPKAAPTPPTNATAEENETVDVNAVKEKYWASGEEKDLGVVQNRTYKKAGRFQIGLLAGKTFGDPFLDISTFGGSFGYHFSEYIGVNVTYMKQIVQSSDALKTFEATRNATSNTNKPSYYLGAELTASLLYGKLSVVGKKIIYYDMYLAGGGGVTKTESGTDPTYVAGLGQRFFVTNNISFRTDYRYMGYKETILEKVIPSKMGQAVAERTSQNHVITLSIDYFFGSGK